MIVLDTHTLIWYISNPDKLSKHAMKEIARAKKNKSLYVSAISIWEIYMLVKKGRLKLTMNVDIWVDKILSLGVFIVIPVSTEIAALSTKLDDSFPADPADRMIAATALQQGCKLVTSDKRIQKSNELQTIW